MKRHVVRQIRRRYVEIPGSLRATLVFPPIAAVLLALTLLWTGSATVAEFAGYLPGPERVGYFAASKTTRVYDRNGTPMWEFFDRDLGRRTPITLDRVPEHVVLATLAAEDADFYSNPGVDFRAVIRALVQNLRSENVVSGASTVTQQLARNTLIEPEERYEQSASRKLKETLLAFKLNQAYSKDEILDFYFNEVFYGNLSYGLGAAAESYFGKRVEDLTLAEGALLAGLPQAPTDYNPLNNFNLAKARQRYVLNRMAELGWIAPEQALKAWQEQLHFVSDPNPRLSPHFAYYVRDLLEQRLGTEAFRRGGFDVVTTIDLNYQAMAQRAIDANRARLKEEFDANNSALVSMNPKTGEILAMLGSVDYNDDSIDGRFNVAISERQPGSSIKPIVYAAAFEKLGHGPDTMVDDTPLELPDNNRIWRPVNWDNGFRGRMAIRNALAESRNIPPIRELMQIGVPEFLAFAKQMGITTFREGYPYGLAIAIGGGEVRPLDMANAYSTFANYGYRADPVAILRITDSRGQVVYQWAPAPPHHVLSERTVHDLWTILSNDEIRQPAFGLNSPLKLSRPAAAKTGSSDDYRDTWCVGFTPQLVTAVWVGNTDNHAMRHALSSRSAGSIWHDLMEQALHDEPVVDPYPAG